MFRQLSIKYASMGDWIGVDQEQNLPPPVNLSEYVISVENVAPHKEVVVKTAAEQKSFSDYYNILYYYQSFLSLATMEPVHPLTVEGITTQDGGASRVRIFFQRQGRRQPPHDKLERQHMSLTYQQIESYYTNCVRNLLDDSRMKPVLDAFFDYYYKQPSMEASRFLNLAQCIEGFHRLAYGGDYIPAKDYKKCLFKEFERAIDEFTGDDSDLAQGLKEKLTHVYEFSLNKRLGDLLKNEVVSSFKSLFVVGITVDEFAKFIVKLRNQLTHPDKTQQIKIPRDRLEILNDKLELLFFTLTLKYVGASSDIISAALATTNLLT